MKPVTKAVTWIAATMIALTAFVKAPAFAADITAVTGKNSASTIKLSGRIEKGDSDTLLRWVDANRSTAPIVFLYLDSPGGNVVEAARIADTITKNNIQTVVGGKARCISACVLAFAGGTTRWFTETSSIGVHSTYMATAQKAGTGTVVEDDDSRAMTLLVARSFYDLGVPDRVIVKMIVTEPSDVTYLKYDDLRGFARLIGG
jgi:hypothetical protein